MPFWFQRRYLGVEGRNLVVPAAHGVSLSFLLWGEPGRDALGWGGVAAAAGFSASGDVVAWHKPDFRRVKLRAAAVAARVRKSEGVLNSAILVPETVLWS